VYHLSLEMLLQKKIGAFVHMFWLSNNYVDAATVVWYNIVSAAVVYFNTYEVPG